MFDKQEVFIGCGISKEQYERNQEHHNEVRNKIKITNSHGGYATHTYTGTVLDETLTTDEVALACDSNLCFGYRGHVNSDGTFSITVYTD